MGAGRRARRASPARPSIELSEDPVVAVRWAADSGWLTCALATDGGVRNRVWVVRPDGSDARRIIAGDAHPRRAGPVDPQRAPLRGHLPGVATGTRPGLPGRPADRPARCSPRGTLIHVLDISLEEQFLVLKDGERGQQYVSVIDRLMDEDFSALTHGATGSTEQAHPACARGPRRPGVRHLASDVGLSRKVLIGLPFGPNGWRGERTLAARDDADLEWVDADDTGRLLLLVWNVAGASEIELFDTATRTSTPITGLPGLVASTPVLSRDGSSVILGVEGPERPRELWHLDTRTHAWHR